MNHVNTTDVRPSYIYVPQVTYILVNRMKFDETKAKRMRKKRKKKRKEVTKAV